MLRRSPGPKVHRTFGYSRLTRLAIFLALTFTRSIPVPLGM